MKKTVLLLVLFLIILLNGCDVNKNLSLLVCASLQENSTKLAKARKLGIAVKELDEWLSSLENLPQKTEDSAEEDDGQLSLF